MSGKSRIVLADDHPIVLAGLRNLVCAVDDLELCGEATTGPAALRVISEQRPDVAVVDISMPGLNGIILVRRLAKELPSVRALVLTLHEDRAYLKQALEAGARGFVLKRSAAENLIGAIRAVAVGGLYVDPGMAHHMSEDRQSRKRQSTDGEPFPNLTDREASVLKFIALGFTNKEIARRLGIGVKSIETHKARALTKLDLNTRADIVRYASAQGWLMDA